MMASKSETKKKTTPKKAAPSAPEASVTETGTATANTSEAKSRFNSALEEAKAGASALGKEAKERASGYKADAMTKGEDWTADAKVKGRELATDTKVKASEGLRGLSKMVEENTASIDDRFGSKYGDYARSASRSISETADKLDQKSVDDLAEDTREAIRKSPAAAVGIAAVVGFMFARLFRR